MIISKWFFFSFFSMAYFGVSGASGSPSDKQSRDKLQLETEMHHLQFLPEQKQRYMCIQLVWILFK
jgi:hypothetical protein